MNKQQNYPNIGTGCGAVAVGVAVVRVTVEVAVVLAVVLSVVLSVGGVVSFIDAERIAVKMNRGEMR